MIKAKKRKILNVDTILSLVSEYSIYRFYLKRDFKLGHTIKSPFREDDNPSFGIMATKSGRLYHTDFARTEYRGTFVDLVMQLYQIPYNEALSRIDEEMGLGINSSKETYQELVKEYKQPKIEKQDTFIQVKAKKFDPSELAYWNSYHIDLQDLKNNDVYSVKKLYINRIQYPINPHDLCFGYLLEDSWKIYWPYAPKKDKWKSNIPIDRMWGMENIKSGCNKVVVTKALKDMIILKKILPEVAATQNESTVSINNINIEILQNNCKEVYLNFDSDSAGIINCTFYNQYGFKWINVPSEYREKDFADLARNQGMESVVSYFKKKGIV
jgi:hypothetical protein